MSFYILKDVLFNCDVVGLVYSVSVCMTSVFNQRHDI